MKRIRWNHSRLLLLTMLAVLVVPAGCEMSEPPGPSATGGDGLGVQLLYPPGLEGGAGKAASDTLSLQLYFLGADSLDAIETRPIFDDPGFVPTAALEVIGDEAAGFEIESVAQSALWRLLARTGSLSAQTTFTLDPSDLQRNVRLVLAETALPDTLVLYDGFNAGALSEPGGAPTAGDQFIYPVALANEVAVAGLDLRFVLDAGAKASILVDPGSRLFGGSGAPLTWNLSKLDFVTDDSAFRLEIAGEDGAAGVIEPGSDILFYIVVDGAGASPSDPCIHAPSAFYLFGEGERAPVPVDISRCPPDEFPPLAAVTVDELDDDTIPAGQPTEIAWVVTEGWGDAVRIDLIDHVAGSVCLTIAEATENDGSFVWPAERCSGPEAGYRLRVTDLASGAVGETEIPFLVGVACAISLTSPNGGEEWLVGSPQEITWESPGDCGETVEIVLLNAGGLCPIITDSAPNTGSFIWDAVERCGESVTGYRVRITDIQTDVRDESEETFSIVDACLAPVGSTNRALEAWCVDVRNGLAYVADGDFGLKIIGVQQPGNPDLVGSTPLGGKAWGVAVAGDYAFVAADTAGLQIVDISAPSDPNVIAEVPIFGNAFAVTVSGAYAYVAAVDGGLQIVSIQDLGEPYVVASFPTTGKAWGVTVVGSRAFVADGFEGGLQIIDVTQPEGPMPVGSVLTEGDASGVVVAGDHAYVADGVTGLLVIDIANPQQPTIVANVDTGSASFALDVAGDHVFVADRGTGIQVVDVTSPGAPFLVDSAPTPGEANWIQLVGGLGYVADLDGGLRIIDVGCYTP